MTEHYVDIQNESPLVRRSDSTVDEKAGSVWSRARNSLMRRFSVVHSTEELHRSEDQVFYGAYGHIRKKLDYSYHSCYVKERQWFHDSIVEDYLCECSDDWNNPCNPWLIFTVGVQGTGKRYTVEQLMREEKLPLLSFVCVDPDEIRRQLPEYSSYTEIAPFMVDDLTRKEAGYIAETLCLAALQTGRNVIFDCGLGDADWYVKYIKSLKEEFPGLRVAIFHVIADMDQIIERAEIRSNETGRMLDEEKLRQTALHIPQAVQRLQTSVDYYAVLRNGASIDLLNDNWENFVRLFTQSKFMIGKARLTRAISAKEKKERLSLQSIMIREKRASIRRFSVLQSTEENHKSDDMKFYGRYKHIRETLDYSYHSNYTFERQRFQDSIISEYLNAAVIFDKNGEVCTTPTEPWIVFTAGAMGAGKSHCIRKMVENGHFPLLAFVSVDPDDIRRHLPEFHLYVSSAPEIAGQLTRKEAGFIAEILTLAGLQSGKNVLVDGSLRDADWYKSYFERLRGDFPSLRIAIIHVTAPREAVFRRAAERALVTGRIVPHETLVSALEQVPKSVEKLKPLVDYHVEIFNPPDTDDIQIVTEGETWQMFASHWMQLCAWVPDRQKMLKKSKEVEEKYSSNGLNVK